MDRGEGSSAYPYMWRDGLIWSRRGIPDQDRDSDRNQQTFLKKAFNLGSRFLSQAPPPRQPSLAFVNRGEAQAGMFLGGLGRWARVEVGWGGMMQSEVVRGDLEKFGAEVAAGKMTLRKAATRIAEDFLASR